MNINNEISEAYCTSEVSKLLKHFGFNVKSEHFDVIIGEHFEMRYGSGKYHDDELGKELLELAARKARTNYFDCIVKESITSVLDEFLTQNKLNEKDIQQ